MICRSISGQLIFFVKYARHAKTSNFVENSSQFGFWGPLSSEHISIVGSGIGSGHLVRVSGLDSILPDLHAPKM